MMIGYAKIQQVVFKWFPIHGIGVLPRMQKDVKRIPHFLLEVWANFEEFETVFP